MLLQHGWIRRDQYDRALVLSARYGETPGFHLVNSGDITDDDLVDFFLRQFSLKHWPRHKLKDIPQSTLAVISAKLAKNLRILPIRLKSQNLTLGITDPSLTHVAEEAAFHTGRFVNPVLVTETDMSWALAHYYGINAPGPKGRKPRATLERETYDLVDNPAEYMSAANPVAERKPSVVQVTDEGWGVDDWNDAGMEASPIPLTRLASKSPTQTPNKEIPNVNDLATLPPPPMQTAAVVSKQPQPRTSLWDIQPATASDPSTHGSEKRDVPTLEAPHELDVATYQPAATSAAAAASVDSQAEGDATAADAALSVRTPVSEMASPIPLSETPPPNALSSIPPFASSPPPEETTPTQNISELLGAMKASDSRDDIIDQALEYLLIFAQRAAFLVLRRDEIRGFAIKGVGTNRTAIKSYWVPISTDSTFREVSLSGQIHLGPLGRSTSDSIFTAALGGRPHRVLVIPVDIHNRVVGLLYADKLRVEMPPWNLLERLAEVVSASLARLIVTKSKS